MYSLKVNMLKSLQNSTQTIFVINTISTQNAYYSRDESKLARRERLLQIRAAQKQIFGRVIPDDSMVKDAKLPKWKNQFYKEGNSVLEDVSPFDIPADQVKVPNIKLALSNDTDEFYWLSQTSNIKIISMNKPRAKVEKKSSSKNTPPPPPPPTPISNSSNDSNHESVEINDDSHTTKMAANSGGILNAASVISTAKNFVQQFVAPKRSTVDKQLPQQIPFDESALKSIVSYPLVCKKISSSQVHKLLDDRTMRLPSISKILQATMPGSARIALRKWKLSKIAELGFDGFKQYEKETLNRGKNFHLAIENFLSSGNVPMPDSPIIKLWQSIDNSLNELKPKPVLLEQPIVHAELKYHGIIDNVSIVRDELCAFEWKTSEKSKPRLTSTYDAPVQLCAYLGALNADPRYDVTVKNGCVVVAYQNGDCANVFNLSEADLRKYWLLWLQRLQTYWIQVKDGTLPDPI